MIQNMYLEDFYLQQKFHDFWQSSLNILRHYMAAMRSITLPVVYISVTVMLSWVQNKMHSLKT